MTREEFLYKWINYSTDTYEAMEFDLISVIDEECKKERLALRNQEEAEIRERYHEEEIPQKAYTMSSEETKKYIKSITFGTIKGA